MYFRDSSGAALLSSVDCKHFELTDEDKDVINCAVSGHVDHDPDYCADDLNSSAHPGLAVNVPGKSMQGFVDVVFPDSNIKGKTIICKTNKVKQLIYNVNCQCIQDLFQFQVNLRDYTMVQNYLLNGEHVANNLTTI